MNRKKNCVSVRLKRKQCGTWRSVRVGRSESINGLAPTYLKEMLSRLSNQCMRELHNTETDLVIPLCKSAYSKKLFSYKSATMQNQLNIHIKISPTLKVFKKHSKLNELSVQPLKFLQYLLVFHTLHLIRQCKTMDLVEMKNY